LTYSGNKALLKASSTAALDHWVTETLVKLDADDRADVRNALRVLGMKIVLPTVLAELPTMTVANKIALLKLMVQMGLAVGGKDDGTPIEKARVVYVLPD